MRKLPYWHKVDKFPAFFDGESLTATQQTARVYGKINELIDGYNKMITELNKEINEFETGINSDFSVYKENITKIITDYMYKIDTQIVHQDRMIEEVYDKFKNHMAETVDALFQEMQDTGELETIIENSVSEFIESLKSSLMAEVTAEVESVMNTIVSNAKNEVTSATSAGTTQINSKVSEGVTTITREVEKGKLELSEAYTNFIEPPNIDIYADQLPYGITYVSVAIDNGLAVSTENFRLFGKVDSDMGIQYGQIGVVEPGSTIIKSGGYCGYQVLVFRNNAECTGYMVSRFVSSEYETKDVVRELTFKCSGGSGVAGEDLDGNGVIDTFDVWVGSDLTGTTVNMITLNDGAIGNEGTTVKEGTSFIATIDMCDNPVTVVMYNDSTETNYTTFGTKYNAGDEIRIEKVTGKIVIY